jgi:hypothetical protein
MDHGKDPIILARRADGFQRRGQIFGGGHAVLVQARRCRMRLPCAGPPLRALEGRRMVPDSGISEQAPRSRLSMSSLRPRRPIASSPSGRGARRERPRAIGLTIVDGVASTSVRRWAGGICCRRHAAPSVALLLRSRHRRGHDQRRLASGATRQQDGPTIVLAEKAGALFPTR